MEITVVGAGMAGLLAGAILRTDAKQIIEKQNHLPKNHSALLRFRSSVVGDAIGIDFKKVKVLKSIVPYRNPVADALAYSKKCSGVYSLRSSISAIGEIENRYIAPDDLCHQMAMRCSAPIILGSEYDWKNVNRGYPIISTIPMPVLMKILKYPKIPEFKFVSGLSINATIQDCDAYCTLYVPDLSGEYDFYRISITGNRLTIEFSFALHPDQGKFIDEKNFIQDNIDLACYLLGIQYPPNDGKVSRQQFMKIHPIDENERKKFMLWATEYYRIYSLGRFATWKPHLLLDDVVSDVRKIRTMIANGHNYDGRK